jgi:LytS/YehU family sensor histidine kinase
MFQSTKKRKKCVFVYGKDINIREKGGGLQQKRMCRYETGMRLVGERWRAKFCTLSPTHTFKTTHSKGKR